MANLTEIARKACGKSSYAMLQYFQGLVDNGEIKAYFAEFDKATIIKENAEEKIVKIKKGLTLTPAIKLGDDEAINYAFIVQDLSTGIRYHLDIVHKFGEPYGYWNTQIIDSRCILEKLAEDFDPGKLPKKKGSGIAIPQDMVNARLKVDYHERVSDKETYSVDSPEGSLVIEGEKDALIDKVCRFVKDGK